MSNRLDRGQVLTLVTTCAAACALGLQPARDHSLTVVLPMAFLYGGFAFALYPMAMARIRVRLLPMLLTKRTSRR